MVDWEVLQVIKLQDKDIKIASTEAIKVSEATKDMVTLKTGVDGAEITADTNATRPW